MSEKQYPEQYMATEESQKRFRRCIAVVGRTYTDLHGKVSSPRKAAEVLRRNAEALRKAAETLHREASALCPELYEPQAEERLL